MFPLLLALFSLSANAADVLTLDQALQESRAHSPQYQRAQAAADEAEARSLEGISGFLPRLSVNGQHLVGFRYVVFDVPAFNNAQVPAIIPTTAVALDLSLNLFDGFQSTNQWLATRHSSEAAQLEASRALLQLESDIRLKFFQALSAQLLADVADQNVKTLQDHLAKTQALYNGGGATKLDALRVDVQLSEALPDQIATHDNVILTRMALTQLMGLEQDDRKLEGTLPAPDNTRLPADLKLDPGKREDLRALQERATAAQKASNVSGNYWMPRVGFLAETQYYNNREDSSMFNTDLYRNAYTVGFNFSWNIFDGGASLSRARQASFQALQADAVVQAAALRAPVEFNTWRRRFLSNVSLYKARRQGIESAQESVRLARLGYEAGSRTNTEVLDTELDLFRARAGLVRAQLDAAEALINLELAVGHHL